jgi:chromosome partitioning protein
MERYVITLRKGGCGKTTTATNLAASLALAGKRVLLVDLDPQANATISVGHDPMALRCSIYDLFTSMSFTTREVIMGLPYRFDILPSHPSLAKVEAGMQATQVGVLKGMLAPVEQDYDYIILDTPPSESYLSVAALAYADRVIIPVQAHYLATQALDQALQDVQRVRQGLNANLRIKGVIFTMVNTRTNVSKIVLDDVRSHYGEYVLPIEIPFSIRQVEASLAGVPMVLFDPRAPGSQAYMDLAEVVMNG